MGLRTQLRRLRKDTRLILAMLGLLLVFLGGLYFLLHTSRDLPSTMVTNRVLLFVLWYIDVLLILTILLVLARNLFKLWIERRRRRLGAKLKTKLVATYIGLSLIPVLVLFFYASELLQQSIERWFTAPVEQVLEQGSAVAEQVLERTTRTTMTDARELARELEGFDVDVLARRPQLDRHLQTQLRREDLDFLAVYREAEFLHGVLDPLSGWSELPEPGTGFLVEAGLDGEGNRILTPPGDRGKVILGAVTIPDSGDPPALIVAGRILEPTLARQTEELIQTSQGYLQLKHQKAEITASQMLLFLMITLLILLASAWVGLYLARRVIRPIQALVTGTRRIMGGDLSHRVDVEGDDELAVLVDSFNRMTAALERGNRELTQANRRLDEERALFLAVVDSVAAGVVALDRNDEIVLCNRVALTMLRQEESELQGRPVDEAWSDPERRKLLRVLDTEPSPISPSEGEEVRLALAGEWKTFEVKVTPMKTPGGEALGRVVVLEDLTELIKAQRLAAWSDAARRIAHEIKNPLTPIQLAAERTLHKHRTGKGELGPVLEDGMEIIVREVETLKSMVDEFSRFARMPSLQPTEIDLEDLVGDTVRLYRGLKERVEVEARIDPGAKRAWADPEQLKSALINLLDNALEATEEGFVRVEALLSSDRLVLRVADTGRGIPSRAKEKLFLPHFSTKGRGTGLGLAIVHRIVADHQGILRVEDNQPRGTVFVIELPLPQHLADADRQEGTPGEEEGDERDVG
ncbi:MAG: ATP-binding protein [Thermoanaerobaculia bacterium]|nr:ATP-binding protein [Thermoanaerobaculia bacterium]